MLKEKVQKDLSDSLRAGDQLKRMTLSILINAIKNRELLKRGQLSKNISDAARLEKESLLNDDEVIEVVASEAKKRKESMEQFALANRQDLADKEKQELDILMAYMPEQLSEEEVRRQIKLIISSLGAGTKKDMPKVMGQAMAELRGRADGKLIAGLVNEELN